MPPAGLLAVGSGPRSAPELQAMHPRRAIFGARKRPLELTAADEAEELKILRVRTAAAVNTTRQVQQVEAHLMRAMHTWAELEQGQKHASLAGITATMITCITGRYLAQLAQDLIVAAEVAESHTDAEQEAAAAEDQQVPDSHAELGVEKPEEPFQEQEGHDAPEFELP